MPVKSKTIETIKGALLLRDLNEEQITKLAEIWEEESFGKGGSLIRAGDVIRNLYLVAQGICDVELQLSGTHKPLVVDSLKKNDIFGEMCFLDGKPKSANVLCKEPTTIIKMRAEDFEKLMKERPDITTIVIRNIALILVEKIRTTHSAVKDSYVHHGLTKRS
jgi:CRP-like cAMP-binding protein